MSLQKHETKHIHDIIKRKLTKTELQIIAAEWSEHCSYKSSKKHLNMLPTTGPNVIVEKGYDSGVLDVGDGYVVTVHIESHNHPSAVEPFGGAATGVGGVIRDILSAGTRPIAILDGLRFGDIENDTHARWLFKNAVSGIADYGNCLGIPTVGGEVEFDDCYKGYALVDVAAIGFGKKNRLIKNHANKGDLVVLVGGSTGRDGMGGSQFASDLLENEDRSAVKNITEADVWIIGTPIYNSFFSSALKNLFEYIDYKKTAGKTAGLVIVAAGNSGFTDVQTLLTQLMSYFNVITNPRAVFVMADTANDDEINDEDVKSRLKQLVDETLKLALKVS